MPCELPGIIGFQSLIGFKINWNINKFIFDLKTNIVSIPNRV